MQMVKETLESQQRTAKSGPPKYNISKHVNFDKKETSLLTLVLLSVFV